MIGFAPLLAIALVSSSGLRAPMVQTTVPLDVSNNRVAAASPDPEEVRQALIEYVMAVSVAFPEIDQKRFDSAFETLTSADPAVMKVYAQFIPNPGSYLANLRRCTAHLTAAGGAVPDQPVAAIGGEKAGFNPAYPPYTGAYWDHILGQLVAEGLVTVNSDRCDVAVWDDLWFEWYVQKIIFRDLWAVCTTAGCDPLGIVCAFTCIAVEAAETVLEISELPIVRCEIQDQSVDSAEIEAAYENTVLLLQGQSSSGSSLQSIQFQLQTVAADLDAHDDSLSAHDASVGSALVDLDADLQTHELEMSGQLMSHDLNIDGDLAMHDANIDADLSQHDTGVRTELADHDTDIKALVGAAQFFLENATELRRIHLKAIELVNSNEFLVTATSAGLPVDVQFDQVQILNEYVTPIRFVDLAPSIFRVETGIYVVNLNLSPQDLHKVVRIWVSDGDTVNHRGHLIFHRENENNVSAGQ